MKPVLFELVNSAYAEIASVHHSIGSFSEIDLRAERLRLADNAWILRSNASINPSAPIRRDTSQRKNVPINDA
jgi:hypothetical protein